MATASGKVQSRSVSSGQALVRLSSGTSAASLDGALAALGLSRRADLGRGWILIGWDSFMSVAQVMGLLKGLPGVAAAEPSHVYTVHRLPSDPLANSQYALSQVNAFAGWEFETGFSSRATVAVIDTGIDGNHPDLAAKLANTTSAAFDPNTGAPAISTTPACQHATEVAGVAAASTDNGLDIAGVSWGAQLVSLKVFADADCNRDCSNVVGQSCATNDPALISALNYAIARQNTPAYGKIVVNMSLGGAGQCSDGTHNALQTAISAAVNAGIVIVASAGNDGGDVNEPANCVGVIPAGATDSANQIAFFSSRGPTLASNGLVAPGVSVLTTDQGGGTASPSGTSFASPMVAGAAALVLSAQPNFTPAQVQANLRAGADNIGQSAQAQGAGRLDLARTLRLTVNGTLEGSPGESEPIAFPNPFRPQSGVLSFGIPQSLQGGPVNIKIYTARGRLVRELPGLSWDGLNGDGNPAASGSYLFVVSGGQGTGRGRFSVLR